MATILVIDDSPTVFLAVRSTLAADGHDVFRLDSPLDLPRYLRDQRTDLILLDLQMPTYSGFSIGAFLRNFDKNQIPIVIYSSRPLPELQAVARRLNAVAVMEKARPCSELRGLVQRQLGLVAAGGGR